MSGSVSLREWAEGGDPERKRGGWEKTMSNLLLQWWVRGHSFVVGVTADTRRRLAKRVSRGFHDERGQTSSEYLMIGGLMAAVIVIAFVSFYWEWVGRGVMNRPGFVRELVR